MKLIQDFKEFFELLNFHKVEYIIVGGFAVGIYGYPRYTGDIDIWILTSEENTIKLCQVLKDFGFSSINLKPEDFRKEDMIFQFGYEPNRIDIITTVSGLNFNDCFRNKKLINYGDLNLNFIDLESLKINKNATGRLKDLDDLEHLP